MATYQVYIPEATLPNQLLVTWLQWKGTEPINYGHGYSDNGNNELHYYSSASSVDSVGMWESSATNDWLIKSIF